MKNKIWLEYLSPLIFACLPILSLANENIEFVNFSSIRRSLIISILIGYVLFLLLNAFVKNHQKSAILTSLMIFLGLTYGNVYLEIETRFGEAIRHRYLAGIYLLIIGLAAYLLLKKLKNAKDLNLAIFSGGFAMVAYLLVSIFIFEAKSLQPSVFSSGAELPSEPKALNPGIASYPDIYLVVLDGHSRTDVIRDNYGYDNSEFIRELEAIGFMVADCAQSNYPGTNFSITSLLEMNYLHEVFEDVEKVVFPPLNRTAVYQTLTDTGYSLVSFQNYFTDHFDVLDDVRFSKEDNFFGSINEFELMVVDTSLLRLLVDMKGFFPKSWVRPFTDNIYLTFYRDTNFILDTLATLPKMEGPKFTYAHILATHSPFVFLSDGSFNNLKLSEGENYRHSVEFIDSSLPDIFRTIIEQSETPPIIILTGDHGATIGGIPIEERLSILFAVYFQGEAYEGFDEGVSPVNAFRMVFDYLFSENYELIENKSYGIWNQVDLGEVSRLVSVPCVP